MGSPTINGPLDLLVVLVTLVDATIEPKEGTILKPDLLSGAMSNVSMEKLLN